MKSIIRIILTLFIFNYSFLIASAQIYVDADATGNADGSSWSNAYVYLQDALSAASNGDEIWVAEGIYYPDEGANKTNGGRSQYFTLISGVSIYGGFNGTESNKNQSSPTQNVSILSGDIDKDGILDDENSYHVLYTSGLSANVTVDGFIIQHGYANSSQSKQDGSGLYNYKTRDYLTISDCIFSDNYSKRRGTILNDVGSYSSLTTTFLNCIFKNNVSKNGGAVHNYGRSANGECAPQFISCLFYGNTATVRGGAVHSWAGNNGESNPVFTNCTFYNNNASFEGDAIKSSKNTHSYLTNCILWQNGTDEFINSTSNGYTTITNCIINLSSYPTNTTDNGNNSDSDPLFEDAANADFRLQDSSPAINAGTKSADLDGSGSGTSTIEDIAQDLQGLPRIDDDKEKIDLGVYEKPDCDCNEIIGTNAGSNITTGLSNSIYGEEAGYSLTKGSFNSIMGYQAGYSLMIGDSSVMMGYQAGYNTTASKNIFVGAQAGYTNTVGSNNYFIGTKAGYNNTTGYNNITIGEDAGINLTTGFNNIIIGENYSLSVETTGRDNIFIGNNINNCSSCSFNVAIGSGYGAGADLSTGSYNVFFGESAGSDLGIGNWNTFIGSDAGYHTEETNYNTFIGASAGWDNDRLNSTSTAAYNTYIGDSCGFRNREGAYNVGIGANAGPENGGSTYDNNTYIGASAYIDHENITLIGYGSAAYKQYNVGVGAYIDLRQTGAIGVGYQSYINGKYAIGIGYQDTISANYGVNLGYQANVADKYGIAIGKNAISSSEYSIALGSGASATGYNSAAIGYNASVIGSHEIVFGNTSTTTIGGTVDFTALSDERYKTNIQENVVGLDFIRALRPVTYLLQVSDTFNISDTYSGFIAQEVEQAANTTNFNFSGIDYRENIDRYGLRYAEFVVPLVKAIQELQPKIEQQEEVFQQQDHQLDSYKAELLELMQEVEALEKE